MVKCLFAWALVGEIIPLLFLVTYRYVDTPLFEWAKLIIWPFSIMLLMTGGGDQVADDQTRAMSILLNGLLYSVIGLAVSFLFLRRRSARWSCGRIPGS
jgi:hypothetical protein